jgi:hypothetical protein
MLKIEYNTKAGDFTIEATLPAPYGDTRLSYNCDLEHLEFIESEINRARTEYDRTEYEAAEDTVWVVVNHMGNVETVHTDEGEAMTMAKILGGLAIKREVSQ